MVRAFLIFLFIFNMTAQSEDQIKFGKMESQCRAEIKMGHPKTMMRLGRYFMPIPIKKEFINFYPLPLNDVKEITFLKSADHLGLINLNEWRRSINDNVQSLKISKKNDQLIEALRFLQTLLEIKDLNNLATKYPCLSLYFKECADVDGIDQKACIKSQGDTVKSLASELRGNRRAWTSNDEFKLLNALQEFFSLHGKVREWTVIPKFEGPEEEQLFLANKYQKLDYPPLTLDEGLAKRGGLEHKFYPRVPAYYPTELIKCLKSNYEKSQKTDYIDSGFYKNECFEPKYQHPITVLQMLANLLANGKISKRNINQLNGSYLFHGTTSRYFAYGFYKKTLTRDSMMVKSRMLIEGAKLLVGEAGVTKTQTNVAWISSSTITGMQKAISYSGVYRQPDDTFFYGPPYPDRATISGLGFYKQKKTWNQDLAARRKAENEQLADMTNIDQRFYFKENFPMAFGFRIPKSFLVSKVGVELLNEIMWFGGFEQRLLRLILVPRKYLEGVKAFIALRGDFSHVDIIAFEDIFTPIDPGYFDQQIAFYKDKNKQDRVEEFTELKAAHQKFSIP